MASFFELSDDRDHECSREGHPYTPREQAACDDHFALKDTKCDVDAITQESIPEHRSIRMYSVSQARDGTQKRLLKCFDALSLKQHVIASRNKRAHRAVLDPSTRIPFSEAQIKRIDSFVLDADSQRELDQWLRKHGDGNDGNAEDLEHRAFARQHERRMRQRQMGVMQASEAAAAQAASSHPPRVVPENHYHLPGEDELFEQQVVYAMRQKVPVDEAMEVARLRMNGLRTAGLI